MFGQSYQKIQQIVKIKKKPQKIVKLQHLQPNKYFKNDRFILNLILRSILHKKLVQELALWDFEQETIKHR